MFEKLSTFTGKVTCEKGHGKSESSLVTGALIVNPANPIHCNRITNPNFRYLMKGFTPFLIIPFFK